MKAKTIKTDSKSDDPKQLAENLSGLLKNHHLNTNQLAQILNIPMMTIRRLVSGETIDPRISTLKLIADYFKVSVDSLINSDSQAITKTLKKTKSHLVPVLSWEMAEKINILRDLDLSKWKEWQTISLSDQSVLSNNAFALESRPSMYPRFPQGTIFIIDPDVTPIDGDMVLVKLRKNNELTLRELTIDPPEWTLYSISGSNGLQYSEQEHQIVGVNVLTMLYNRQKNT